MKEYCPKQQNRVTEDTKFTYSPRGEGIQKTKKNHSKAETKISLSLAVFGFK